MKKCNFLLILLVLLQICLSCTVLKFSKSKKVAIDFLNKSNQKRYEEALVYFRQTDIEIFNNPKSRVYVGGVAKNLDISTHNGTITNINIYGGFIRNDTANILLKLKFQDGQTVDWNGKPYYFQMVKEKSKWKVMVNFPK